MHHTTACTFYTLMNEAYTDYCAVESPVLSGAATTDAPFFIFFANNNVNYECWLSIQEETGDLLR